MRTDMQRETGAWYLIQCKPRQDERALEHLSRQGFEHFCPLAPTPAGKPRADKHRPAPLFPGYLFLYMPTQGNWSALRSTRGVSRVVSFGATPCRINDAIISQLKYRTLQLAQAPTLSPGDSIYITSGPLAELEAICMAVDSNQRVTLLLRLLNQEQQISIPLSQVARLQA